MSRRKHRDYFEADMRQGGFQFEDSELIIDLLELFPPPRRILGGNQKIAARRGKYTIMDLKVQYRFRPRQRSYQT